MLVTRVVFELQVKFMELNEWFWVHLQDLYEAMNKMKDPSMIRVESDELTYPMHVILRCVHLSTCAECMHIRMIGKSQCHR